jgi:hypothetical protein
MLIPLIDLRAQHRQIAHELQQGFARLFENTAFIFGEEVASFERAFAQFSGVKHCVGVGNGTDALEMMLCAAGVGDSDKSSYQVTPLVPQQQQSSALAQYRGSPTQIPKPILLTCRRWRGRSTAAPRQLCRCASTAKSRPWRN